MAYNDVVTLEACLSLGVQINLVLLEDTILNNFEFVNGNKS